MNQLAFQTSKVQEAFAALKKDLIHEDGPRISTMRNYPFALVPYPPAEEFKLRAEVQRLSGELEAAGWVVLTISLQGLLLDRVRAQGPEWVASVIAMEKRIGREKGLNHLRQKLTPLLEGPTGIAADCSRLIREFAQKHPDKVDRTLVLIGRTGALFPFFRASSLLKHLDGHTQGIPAVLLYPGERRGLSTLSFMGVIEPDSDYRPRIYP